MNLFDELCKDAKADLDSGVFLQADPTKGDNAELNKRVDEVEKKMEDTLKQAMDKITQVTQPTENVNVPGANQSVENNTNKDSEVNENGNNN